MRRKGEEGMSKSRHTEAQMSVALKQLEAGRAAEDVGMWHRVRVFCFVPTCFEKCAILTSRVVFL